MRPSPASPRVPRAAFFLSLFALASALLGQQFWPGPAAPAPSVAGKAAATLPAPISLQALPPEARQTLTLIEQGGPFPYRKDGSVFGNREARLPARARGCYREYTVPTPGERDRGARRIVTACDGPRYYTADHYRSFLSIQP